MTFRPPLLQRMPARCHWVYSKKN